MNIKSTYLLSAGVLMTGLAIGFITKPATKLYSPRTEKFLENEESESSEEGREARGMLSMMQTIRANQITGIVDPKDVQNAVNQANRLSAQRGSFPLQWEELGPDNVGGRTRAILIDRRNHNNVFVGAVSGGLWKSISNGTSWKKITDPQPSVNVSSLSVSSITQTPNGDIYYGTGEGVFGRAVNGSGQSGFTGGGVYYSNDGVTFTLLGKTDPSKNGQSAWNNVQAMASDLLTDRVYATNNGGLWWSENQGVTWTRVTTVSGGTMQDIKVAKNGTVYTCTSSIIYKSTDGKTYARVGNPSNPTPTNTNIPTGGSRIELAVSPTDPNYVYAQVAGSDNKLLGIYQSTDAGATWTRIGQKSTNNFDFDPLSNPVGGQGDYNNVIAVAPEDPGRIFSAGVQLWEWKDPNTHAANISGWTKIAVTTGGFLGNNLYVHADKHAIVFDTLTKPYTTYIGSDGGVGKSLDGCKTFIQSNKGYNVTQFYGMAKTTKDYVLAGSQDNGTQFIKGNGNTRQSAIEINGGDGFQCAASIINPDLMFYETYYGDIVRSGNGGQAAAPFFDCEMVWFTDSRYGPHSGAAGKCEDKTADFNRIFNTPMYLSENPVDSSSRFLTMMHRQNGSGTTLWLSKDATDLTIQGTPQWYRVSEVAGGGNEPCRIELSKDWNWAWYVSGAGLWRVRGLKTGVYDTILAPRYKGNFNPDNPGNPAANGIITDQLNSPSPGRAITGVKQDPSDPNHLIVSLGNYGNSAFIYETKNALDTVNAVTWTSIQGNLPQMPVYDIAFLPFTPNVLIAGTEMGVYVSTNGGASWTENNGGMARVPVFQVKVYQNHSWAGPSVYIATHGRGMFRATNLVTSIAKPNNPASLRTDISVFPNPASEVANIGLSLSKASDVRVTVMDMSGKTVLNMNYGNKAAGQQQLPLNVGSLANGVYVVNVTGGFGSASKKILVSH
ncbi:MAG: T9SS type A sorting domain-containing protein [Flavobacteriaceae bacterium]|nr:T9SS type A sorting domain-containing protein [Flavobacteriaceae bacterium]